MRMLQDLSIQSRRVWAFGALVMLDNVHKGAALIGGMSTAASEEGEGMKQINSALPQLDQVTQQNAALVEESADAAQRLNAQSARLVGLGGVSRLPQAATD